MDRSRLIREITAKGIGDDKPLRVVRSLGRGGNGVAFLCENDDTSQVVAKVYIPPDHRDLGDKALQRFETEIKATAKLKHPNVIPSLGSGAVSLGAYRLPYYLMPYADGTLRKHIDASTDAETLERKMRSFIRACLALARFMPLE